MKKSTILIISLSTIGLIIGLIGIVMSYGVEGSSNVIMNNTQIRPTPIDVNGTLNCSANYYNNNSYKGNVSITWYNGSTPYFNVTQLNKASGSVVNEPLTWVDTNGLILYYKFSEGNGTSVKDSSGNPLNNGTLYNGSISCTGMDCPTWNASGKYGYGMTFDGINDYIIPASL